MPVTLRERGRLEPLTVFVDRDLAEVGDEAVVRLNRGSPVRTGALASSWEARQEPGAVALWALFYGGIVNVRGRQAGYIERAIAGIS